MTSINKSVGLLKFLSRLTKTHNLKSTYYLFFIFYAIIKLKSLLGMQLKLQCIPKKLFLYLIMKHGKCNETQVDENLQIICNSKSFNQSKKWFYLCCASSKKKYKVVVIFTDDIPNNCIYTSEILKHNVNRKFNSVTPEEEIYFLSKILTILLVFSKI